MILNGFRAKGKSLSEGLQNNMIPVYPDMQNLNNWGAEGSGTVSIDYEDGVNTLVFSNYGNSDNIKTMLVNFAASWGYNISTSNLNTLMNRMNELPNYNKLILFITQTESRLSALVGEITSVTFDNNILSITHNTTHTALGRFPDLVSQPNLCYNSGTGVYSDNARKYELFPTLGEMKNTKKYSVTLSADTSKLYLVKFQAYSSSGFTAGSSSNVVITCGANITNGNISNVASNDFAKYEYMVITDEVGTINLKFDLEQMTKVDSDITLKLKDFGIYYI